MESNGRYTNFINQQNGTTNTSKPIANQAGGNYTAPQAGASQATNYTTNQAGASHTANQAGANYTASQAGNQSAQYGQAGAPYYQARYGGNGYIPNQLNQGNQPNQATQQNTYQARYGSYNPGHYQAAYQTTEQQPPKKKKKVFTKILIAALIILGIAGIAFLGVFAVKSIGKNVNFSINGKTLIGDEAGIDGISGLIGGKADADEAADTDGAGTDATAGVNANGTDTNASTIKQAALGTGTGMTVVTDVTEVVKNTMPCLVSVNNAFLMKRNYFGQTYEQKGNSEGSGIIVGQNDTELLLVSNNHVVQDAEELTITFVDDAQVPGYVKGTDRDKDLAVIAVLLEDIEPETMNAIAIAQLGDSEALTVGEPVVAIGNSLGYGQSVTTGVVSALHRPIGVDMEQSMYDPTASQGDVEVATFIQTDAAINPGNSGGALLNIYGQVIGINSNKIGGSAVEGMGYAIPISDAKPIIEDLMTQETKIKVAEDQRGVLGITGVNVEKQYAVMYGMPEGVYISSVNPGSGAEAAGMTKGDIIVKLEDRGIESMDELKGELAYFRAGDKVTVTIMRANNGEYESQEVEVTLTK